MHRLLKRKISAICTVIFLLVAIVICCPGKGDAAPEKGKVVGVLIKKDGSKYEKDVSVFAFNKAMYLSKKLEMNFQYKTNSEGKFVIDKVTPGNYVLYTGKMPAIDFDKIKGPNDMPKPTFGILKSKGQPITFTVPEDKGVDLGIIEVSETTYISAQELAN